MYVMSTFTQKRIMTMQTKPILSADYLPFDPMPTNIADCQKLVAKRIRAMDFGVPSQDSILWWLAGNSDLIDDVSSIDHFVIEENGGNAFVVVAKLSGGGSVGFSYRWAVENFYNFTKRGKVKSREEKHTAMLKRTMRRAVDFQCVRWERANPKSSPDHVRDHAYPLTFSALYARFLAECGGHGQIAIKAGTRETRFKETLADAGVLRRWRDFHEKHARLRWIDAKVNMAIGEGDPCDFGHCNLPAGTPIPPEKKGFGMRWR
jgi:hypothetical protein